MLPLENIFDIARDELKNNADEYVLDTNRKILHSKTCIHKGKQPD